MMGANQKESFWSGKFGLLQTLMMLVEILLLLDLMVIYSITKKVQAFKVFKEDDQLENIHIFFLKLLNSSISIVFSLENVRFVEGFCI